jgi:hypothetical protein
MKTCFAKNVFFLWVMAIAFFPLACGEDAAKNRIELSWRSETPQMV